MTPIIVEEIQGNNLSVCVSDITDIRQALRDLADRIIQEYKHDSPAEYTSREEDWTGHPYPKLIITATSDGQAHDLERLTACTFWSP